MKKSQFSKDIKAKDSVASIFLVKYVAMREARDGKTYVNLILTDSTGDLESRVWNAGQEIAEKLYTGSYQYIKGKTHAFQGRLQLIVEEFCEIEKKDINPDDYRAKSNNDPEIMFNSLIDIIDSLNEPSICSLLKNILNDESIKPRLLFWPAGKTIHHAYQSGLLEHILSCTELAVSLSDKYQVNKNYVVAGTILHDIMKVEELSEGPVHDYTTAGKLIGHLIMINDLIEKKIMQMNDFPEKIKLHLKHIILSHHGELEYGSPKLPMTKEAVLVHMIDLMDSKMASLDTIIKTDKNPGKWSGYINHLGRTVYKKELPEGQKAAENDSLAILKNKFKK